MIVKSIWLRKIHKWVGLVIGLQFLIWAISGTAMALINMEEVSGGPISEHAEPAQLPATSSWAQIQRQLGDVPVSSLSLRSPAGLQAIQVTTTAGVKLFDPASGRPIVISRPTAARIAAEMHPGGLAPTRVTPLTEVTLAVRGHQLPIWRADFTDEKHNSYYVSGTTGAVLERRNDSWRWWDFFWMLHNMDYADRTSFNHPLIIMVGFAMTWIAVTGFWLLFRTMWRHDFRLFRGAIDRFQI